MLFGLQELSDRLLVGYYGFLHFICPIQSGDYDADGPTVAAGAIQVGTGWLRDTAGNPAVLTHAALTADSEFKVDAILPYVTGVEITSSPDSSVGYATGETIEITVTFNETVTVPRISRSDVSGYPKPKITIDIGGEARTADFHSTDANSVLFTYDVTTGDQDSDGVSIDANKLSLNGGAIWDQARNTPLTPESDGIMELGLDAAVTHSALDDDSSHKVTTVIAAVTPLTAGFQDAPDSHEGTSEGTGAFTFRIAFSEPISISYVTLRDNPLDVTNGSATKAKRMNGQSDLWQITVEPDSDADVTVVLPITENCAAQDAVCTRDNKKLSNRLELTVPGPEGSGQNSPATGAPTITGTAQVGETLTAVTSGIEDVDGLANVSFSYQWLANDAEIAGATDPTYTLVDDDAGLTIKVKVSFFDDKNNQETLTSAATAAVEAAAPAPGPITGFTVVDASDQSVEGALADGGTLALDDPDGGSFGIRADLESGATIGSMSLQLTGAKTHDQTENIAPYSLYGDSGGNLSGESLPVGEYTLTATAYSEARLGGNVLGTLKVSFSVTETATQQPNTPATGLPTISGTARVGETLRADISGIADVDGMSGAVFSYQWLANEVNIDTDIAGATDPTYTLVAADVGKTIRVKVCFTDDADNVETRTSAPTAAVVLARPGAPQRLVVSAHDSGAFDLQWEAPVSDGGSPIAWYKVQWKKTAGSWDTSADVSKTAVTGTTHTITGLTDGVEYAVRVIATNSVGDGPPSKEVRGTPGKTTPLEHRYGGWRNPDPDIR